MEHLTGMVLGVVFWGFLAAIILVPMWLKHRDRLAMQETLKLAIERGQPLPPELIGALQTGVAPPRVSTPERDLRQAVVLIAVAIGLCILGYGLWYGLSSVSSEAAYISGACTAGAGAIPGMIGLAHLMLWYTRRERKAGA